MPDPTLRPYADGLFNEALARRGRDLRTNGSYRPRGNDWFEPLQESRGSVNDSSEHPATWVIRSALDSVGRHKRVAGGSGLLITFFSARKHDISSFESANVAFAHGLEFHEARLTPETAVLARGRPVVCAFVSDRVDREVLNVLAQGGTRLVVLRSAGSNNVDLNGAAEFGIAVARVPAYAPDAVAEFAIALMLTLDRRLHRAYNRVREGNFALDGLMGRGLHGRTVGIVGMGRIGALVARILSAFGCSIVAFDPIENPECVRLGVKYVGFEELLGRADIISVHCPLTSDTFHLFGDEAFSHIKDRAMLINTSRGAVVDTAAAISALKSGRLGSLGLDVYEEEDELFFVDRSDLVISDDVFARLLTFPNVVITGHQGFFTEGALREIAETTLESVTAFETGRPLEHEVTRVLK